MEQKYKLLKESNAKLAKADDDKLSVQAKAATDIILADIGAEDTKLLLEDDLQTLLNRAVSETKTLMEKNKKDDDWWKNKFYSRCSLVGNFLSSPLSTIKDALFSKTPMCNMPVVKGEPDLRNDGKRLVTNIPAAKKTELMQKCMALTTGKFGKGGAEKGSECIPTIYTTPATKRGRGRVRRVVRPAQTYFQCVKKERDETPDEHSARIN
jgi:hypothetical protein